MLTRRHIRIKVMQTLYSSYSSGVKDLKSQINFYDTSTINSFDLYYLLLSVFNFVLNKAHEKLSFQKNLNNSFSLTLENKILSNPFFIYLNKNKSIKNYLKKRMINNWSNDSKYINEIYDSIKILIKPDSDNDILKLHDDLFCEYFYKHFIASSKKIYDYIEDFELTWIDDFPLVNTYILKQIKSFYLKKSHKLILPHYRSTQDELCFGRKLLKSAIDNDSLLYKEIVGKTPNWDTDRIANLDYVLIKMAITEFLFFQEIPVKVTINEYLEIAKDYSTPKSSIFINGVLDHISKSFNKKGKLIKKGRGLL